MPTKPATPVLDPGHPLAAGLVAAWLMVGTSRVTVADSGGGGYNLAWNSLGGGYDPFVTGPGGNAIKFDGTAFATDTVTPVPMAAVTVAVRVLAPSSSDANATFSAQALTSAELLAHVPFGDGKVYWDCGGNSSPNRISWTPPGGFFGASTWHDMVFVAGPSGSRIVSDGVVVASQSTAISRNSANALANPGFNLGYFPGAGGLKSTNALEFCLLYSREWSAGDVASFSADPYGMFRGTTIPRPPVIEAAQGIQAVEQPAGHAIEAPVGRAIEVGANTIPPF